MKKKILLITTMCVLLSSSIHSQVTIGSGQPPNKGALLDLKTETDGSSKLGLGLPRVELSNLTPTTNADLAKSIGNATGSYDMAEHVGLIVYNVKDAVYNPATCKTEGAGPAGLYVWDGSKWQGIGMKEELATADPLESETATTLTDRDGNTYYISSFGAAGIWMTENLRTKTAPGLTSMTESVEHSTIDMRYTYPNGGLVPWTAQQGLLYNWQATMNRKTCMTVNQGQVAGTTPGPNEVETTDGFIQGICPFGWHVPSDREWNLLEKEIATKTSLYTQTPLANGSWTASWETAAGLRGTIHGTALKSKTGVTATNPSGDSKTAANGGFDLLLVGSCEGDFGSSNQLWSSSSNNNMFAWRRIASKGNVGLTRNGITRSHLFSVRCKKN